MKSTAPILAAALLSITTSANSQVILTNEHVDLGNAFEDGTWDLHIHDETNDVEYAPDEAILQIGIQALTTVPANPLFSFLGAPGTPIWINPQVQNPDLLLLGIGAEEIGPGVLIGDQYTYTLTAVTSANGGNFSAYTEDVAGVPVVYFNSADGFTARDSRVLPVGGHVDINWAFSEPGEYEVIFQASAIPVGGTVPVIDSATYTFNVIPEPGSTLLLGLGAILLGQRRRRA